MKEIDYNLVQYRVNNAFMLAMRISMVLIIVSAVFGAISPVFADGGGGGGGGDSDINVDEITGVFEVLGKMFIDIVLSLMVIVFAVGMVRSGFAVQVSQQFGMAGKVSTEVANMVGGIITFVVGMLTLQLVRWIISSLDGVVKPNSDLSDLKIPGR